jgi:hypothetical protein
MIPLPHVYGLGSVDTNGDVLLDQTLVRRVGIENLADVAEHQVSAAVGSVAHHVKFRNGGELYYVYNQRGEVVELAGNNVCCHISRGGDYLFGMLQP